MAARRLMRSVLFTPGDRLKAIEKSFTLPADVVIIDLEDAVAHNSKDSARDQVLSFLQSYGKSRKNSNKGPAVVVRTNCPFRSSFGDKDFNALSDPSLPIDAICVPKVDCDGSVERLIKSYAYIAQRKLPIWAMIETAKGVQNCDEIARNQHIDALILGSNDLSKELGARQVPSRLPLVYSISKLVLAARCENKFAIDGVFMNIKNTEELAESCKQGRDFGFHGKSLIHPNQIESANISFSPSEEEIKLSKEILTAFEEAQKNGKGVCVVRDKLVEHLHVIEAQAILDMDRQIRERS